MEQKQYSSFGEDLSAISAKYKHIYQLMIRFALKPPHIAFVDNTILAFVKSLDRASYDATVQEIKEVLTNRDIPFIWFVRVSKIEFYNEDWTYAFLESILEALSELGSRQYK